MDKQSKSFGLKAKFLGTALVVFVVTGLFAFGVLWNVVGRLTERLGLAYARNYTMATSAVLREPLEREITLARLMADAPVIREWVENETDETKRTKALTELAAYEAKFADKCWFMVINSSLHYHFDDPEHRYGPTRLAYTLNPEKTEDQWYFATLKDVKDFAINVNYDRVLDSHKIWINVLMHGADGPPIGLAGTGLDLSKFLHETVDNTEPGVETIIIDQRMAIQAIKDRTLIDQHSIAKSNEALSKVDRLFDDPNEVGAMQTAFAKLKNGSKSETFFVQMHGRRCIAGVAYVPGLDWYVLSVIDLNQVIGKQLFAPLVIFGAVLTLILFAVTELAVSRVVLQPVTSITAAAKRMADGDYEVELSSVRRDEIGTLARTFDEMRGKIRDHAENLEQRIEDRTAQLNATNIQLQENMKNLEHALASVRTLEGILPICASCKKIRDDEGYWTQVEAYVTKHSSAEFSHGICPDCMEKIYPDYSAKILNGQRDDD